MDLTNNDRAYRSLPTIDVSIKLEEKVRLDPDWRCLK
jgi:hypothetical protein